MKLILGKKFDEQPEIKDQSLVSKLTVDKAVLSDIVKNVPIAGTKQPVLTADSLIIDKAIQTEKTAGIMPDEILSARRQFLYEDIEKREQNGKHYVANDGTATAIFQNQAVHYLDPADNKLKDIDNSLIDADGVLKTKANDFTAQFNKNPVNGRLFELTKKDCSVSLISHEAAAVKGALKLENKENEVILKNFKDNTDIQYIVESGRIKENIIINKKADSYEYNFDLNIENMTAAASEDGKTLQLKSKETGEVIFYIPAPFMTDANGAYSDLAWYEIEDQNKNTLSLKVFADAKWLNAQDRTFPVIIDPQIISADTSLFSHRNYYRLTNNNNNTWYTTNDPCMIVGFSGSMELKSILTIKKSLIDPVFLQKIDKVTLKVRTSSGSGYYFANEISTYFAPGSYSSVDITDAFIAAAEDCNIEFKMESSYYSYIQVDVSGQFAPVLEVEYLANDDSVPAKESFSLAGGVNGTLNLNTGEFVAGFTDAITKNSALACKISHVYKKTSENYGCGKNWRLNLHQTLVKNTAANMGVDYIYTDADGEKHGFIETYYYLDSSNNKVPVDKKDVTVELDGSLWYKPGSGGPYEVFKDQRTSSGMILSTKMEGFKNAENLEQRQKEQKQTEDYLEACKNNLKEHVIMNTSNGLISGELKNSFSGDILSSVNFNTFVSDGSASGKMVLSKGEAMQFNSLLLQKKQIEDQLDAMNKQKASLNNNITSLGNNITSLNNNITSLGNNITSLNNNITSLGNNITSLGNSITSLGNSINSISVQLTALDHQYDSLVTSRQALVDQNNDKDVKVYQYADQYSNLTNQINHISVQKNSLTTQRNDLTTQKNDITTQKNDLTTQK
ncbi:MAG: hypothetical protein FWH43_08270, partial [Endomicrobia bacterium]|nr:hypothetical protein [Endomicrobiia bacterium]